MNVISNILYWISTGLLVPVMVLLIFFFIRALIQTGAFFGQYLQEKKVTEKLLERVNSLTPSTIAEFGNSLPVKAENITIRYMKMILDNSDNTAKIDLLLNEYEIAADKNISSSKILTKMGPILGLMGTLIPMGPALVGLASGDIASMAYNMQIAFATTVIGLVISAIGFLTQQSREHRAQKDITLLEYLAEIVKSSNNNKP